MMSAGLSTLLRVYASSIITAGLRNPPAHHSPKERSRQIQHGVTSEDRLHRQFRMDQATEVSMD